MLDLRIPVLHGRYGIFSLRLSYQDGRTTVRRSTEPAVDEQTGA